MGHGKKRFLSWRSSLFKLSPKANTAWPAEFICPISMSPMSDPVIVSSGQTCERRCIEAWMELGHQKCYLYGVEVDHSTVIPNIALRTAISNWCQVAGVQKPCPPDWEAAKDFARRIIAKENGSSTENSVCDSRDYSENGHCPGTPNCYGNSPNSNSGSGMPGFVKDAPVQHSCDAIEKFEPADVSASSTENLVDAFPHLPGNPPIKFSHSATELNMQRVSLDSSSSGDLCIPLPLATKPSSYSSQPQEIFEKSESSYSDSYLEIVGYFMQKLQQAQTSEQEQAVIDLRKLTWTSVERFPCK